MLLLFLATGLISVLSYPGSVLALGLGQAHWLGGPYENQPSLKFGYSSSTSWDLSSGDSWAAVEPQQGVYNWQQLDAEVALAKRLQKKLWLQIQTSDEANAEHNVPKWAIDQHINLVQGGCGTRYAYYQKPTTFDPKLINPADIHSTYQKEVPAGSGNYQTWIEVNEKIPAIWDPLYRRLFSNTLVAMKQHFSQEFANGTIEAVNIITGHYGESNITPQCYASDPRCGTPDVLKPSCPILTSLSQVTGKPASELAQKSNCNSGFDPATGQGEPIVACQSNCPSYRTISGATTACYVVDDYYIQAVKDLITRYVKIFDPTPVVFQYGDGPSGTGRVADDIMRWAGTNFGSRVWFKANSWNPHSPDFFTKNFNRYGSTRHGYEPGVPWFFSRDYWKNNSGDTAAKAAIKQAVQAAIVDDSASYLTVQSAFYDGGSYYYFNPADNTPNCAASEISNWCPGFLNSVMAKAPSPAPIKPLPSIYYSPNPITPIPATLAGLSTWKQQYLNPTPPLTADLNQDGLVDLQDLAIWKTAYLSAH
jgi:hypothetical protein